MPNPRTKRRGYHAPSASLSPLPRNHILPTLDLHTRSRQLRINRAERLPIQHQARVSLSINLRLRHLFFNLSLIITPLILDNIAEHGPVENAQNQQDPEDVDHLQHRQKSESDGIRNPALVLLSVPVEIVRTNGREFAIGEHGIEDFEVQEVAHVRPNADEGDEVGDCEVRVEVVEDLGSLRMVC
jgi:hypothetical protein